MCEEVGAVQVFGSVALDEALRRPLLARLADLHTERPLTPTDPRDAVARIAVHLDDLGLTTVRIRGLVSVGSVEVDHVWLAVGATEPWVLDPSFPLHAPDFGASLAGYVAGTLSREELVAVAARARIEDRVVGALPAGAVYRGEPWWGSTAN